MTMLHLYLQRIYTYTPIKKWWYIWKRIKLYLLLKQTKKDLKNKLEESSIDEFIDIIPEFCSIVLDVGSNEKYKVDQRVSVQIIEYIKNFYITYILRIDSTSDIYGDYTIRYSFSSKDSDRLQFRLSLKDKINDFSFYDGYLEKNSNFIISKDIKYPMVKHTKDIIYDAMCIIIDNTVNKSILGKEVDSYEKEELREDPSDSGGNA